MLELPGSRKAYEDDVDTFFEDYMELYHSPYNVETMEDFIIEDLFADDEESDVEDLCAVIENAIEKGVDNKLTEFYIKNLKFLNTPKERSDFLSDNDITEHHLYDLIELLSDDIHSNGIFSERFMKFRWRFYDKEGWDYWYDSSKWD